MLYFFCAPSHDISVSHKTFYIDGHVNKDGGLYFSHVLGSYGYECARSLNDENLVYKFIHPRTAEEKWDRQSKEVL